MLRQICIYPFTPINSKLSVIFLTCIVIASLGGCVTRQRTYAMGPRVARVRGGRDARCSSLPGPVGVLMEITLHAQLHGSRSARALSLY